MTSAFFTDAERATANEILAIPEEEPERLFPNDPDGIARVRKDLAKKWHPDINKDPKAEETFKHVNALAAKAEEKIVNGTWHTPGLLEIEDTDGKKSRLKYIKRHSFELGEFYISSTKVAYVVREQFKDLFDNAVRQIENFKFPNKKMEEGFSTYLPKVFKKMTLKNGDRVLIVEKEPDAILLRDLFNHSAGKMDPRHVAWIMSRFHNFTALLQATGMTHNAVSLDTCFILGKDRSFKRATPDTIAPKDHALSVLGGWWYAVKAGDNLRGLPEYALPYASRATLSTGEAEASLDRTLIRVAARELMGDATGVRLSDDKKLPKAMVNWLTTPGSGNAIEDFQTWRDKILIDAFGPRKFIEMNVSPDDVYALKI